MSDEEYTKLMTLENVDQLADSELLRAIGQLIDQSEDLGRVEGTDRASSWCDILAARNITDVQKTTLEYFRANLWSARGHIKEKEWKEKQKSKPSGTTQPAVAPTIEQGNPSAWEQPERQNQILALRRCVNSPGFKDLSQMRRCQVYTNLANQLNVVGRPVDAIEYWNRALSEREMFGMALGNMAYGILYYAKAMYDEGHQRVFIKIAYDLFNAALSEKAFYESNGYQLAKDFFESQIQRIREIVTPEFLKKPLHLPESSLGSIEMEIAYRKWCLENRLFLNPLNDVTTRSIASHDVLVLPSYVTARETPPTYLGFFNEMKQEYASARWLLFEGIQSQGSHFSDKGVALYDTLDYPSHSISVEKVKIAFRVVYSLFDKIGYFLNDYMQLGINSKKVFFRSVWFEKGDSQTKTISSKFLQSENWPFRGLFWLSKDLHDKIFTEEMEPDAKALSEIRNHLEHKYLKVHEILAHKHEPDPSASPDWIDRLWENQLAYSITRNDLIIKTIRLMKVARAALIYLCLGMRREEQRRYLGKDPTKIFPIHLKLYDNNGDG